MGQGLTMITAVRWVTNRYEGAYSIVSCALHR